MRVLIGCSCPRLKTQEKALEISTWPLSVFVCRLDDSGVSSRLSCFITRRGKGGRLARDPAASAHTRTARPPRHRAAGEYRARASVSRDARRSLDASRDASRLEPNEAFFSERAPEPRARLRDDARRRDASTRLCRLPRRPPTLAWPPSPPRATSRPELCRPPAHERAASP